MDIKLLRRSDRAQPGAIALRVDEKASLSFNRLETENYLIA
jgi:hypothetical protein